MLALTELKTTLVRTLDRPGVAVAYLFGSYREGRAHKESDVDVGILLDRATYPTRAARFEARLELINLLTHGLAPLDPDVVILNDAPPGLAARIATTGLLVGCRDPEAEHAFRRDAQLRAADLEPFLRRARAVKLRAIQSP
ncbi:MAG TPA: nucleotidyltransferase domain-containing protein [Gammaproteobacteria bacterium]|nr:nucleotidyltransferase domain-containing protein [Gammaproteobacteria bacterium]